MPKSKIFLIMAGGTGGHVFPALATAQELMARHHKVHWLGTVGGMETEWVPKADIAISTISIKGLRGKGKLALLKAPFQIVRAIWQAMMVIKLVKPDCVLGMGGFVTGPGGVAAKLMRKPLVIHEQNAVAGMTNRLLFGMANTVLEAFPYSFQGRKGAHLTGNPLRQNIVGSYQNKNDDLHEQKNDQENPRRLNVLVVGGSLGAVAINEVVPVALSLLDEKYRPLVRHQTGGKNIETTKSYYKNNGVYAQYSDSLVPFINDMEEAYKWADLVICRAGALTIAELCMSGVAAVLVPFPSAVDDHQTKNAEYMVKGNAALLVPQSQLSAEKLAVEIVGFSNSPEKLKRMGSNAVKLSRPRATEMVVNYLEEACHV